MRQPGQGVLLGACWLDSGSKRTNPGVIVSIDEECGQSRKIHPTPKECRVCQKPGTAEMRQHRESGTLLVMQDVQPIVPVSDLVKIGVTVDWSATGCVEAFYMRRSRLRVAAVRAEPNQHDLEMVEAATTGKCL